jgi:ribosomal protein L7/L12
MTELILGHVIGLIIGVGIALLVTRITAMTSRLERKIDALIKHAGIDLHKVAADEAAALARAGKKLEAIKAYRDYTGCGLAEAKAQVEAMS